MIGDESANVLGTSVLFISYTLLWQVGVVCSLLNVQIYRIYPLGSREVCRMQTGG